MPKNEPLPPLSEPGPCRRGCGRELGAMPGPRAKHENRCDGTPKSEKPVARRQPKARGAGKRRRRPSTPAPADNGHTDNWVAMTRERARLLRESGERQIKQATRLEEVAAEFEGSF